MTPKYHILKLHGKDPSGIAAKVRGNPALRAEIVNEITILENRERGGRIIDRCVVSYEYCGKLRAALELADAPQ
jgi:hypothetical protein